MGFSEGLGVGVVVIAKTGGKGVFEGFSTTIGVGAENPGISIGGGEGNQDEKVATIVTRIFLNITIIK